MTHTTEDLLIAPGQGERTESGMTIKIRAQQLGGDFSVMEAFVGPNELLAPHTHQHEDQAVFVIEGELEFEVGGEGGLRFTAPAGSYVIKPRGVMHCFWNKHDTPVRYIELSGRIGFEQFVDSTGEEGALKSSIKAKDRFGIDFHEERIPKLLVQHCLTGIAGMDEPWKKSEE